MIDLRTLEAWFVTGSQHLYGNETLAKVAEHSNHIARCLSEAKGIPVRIVQKPVLTTPDAIRDLCREANAAKNCVGLIAWMHTFSPAKMWIVGLKSLAKPFVHLHTQFNCSLPWNSIDMDFMNLNQSAHGDREFGFIGSRLRLNRKVVVGFWQDEKVVGQLATWCRAAAAWHDSENLKVARFGDNMREVAVTEGDKVAAQSQLKYSVNGYGVADLVKKVNAATDAEVDRLVAEYEDSYAMDKDLRKGGSRHATVREAARIEAGLRAFLQDGGFGAFTDTFEDLNGLAQLPGLAVQRLMAEGYGFGAEGDWKHAALCAVLKAMAKGLPGGTAFMEDYTYDFGKPSKVRGAHMLEVCPSIAAGKPSLEVHPLGIGGKADPARLVFTAAPGAALNVSIIDMGERFRMIVNEVDTVAPDADLPKLPVARAVWIPRPNLEVGAAAWILAGGAHHTGYSDALTTEHMADFAGMAGIEMVVIDADTKLREFRNELRWNDAAYLLSRS